MSASYSLGNMQRAWINALCIFCISCVFYLLSYNGISTSSDEELYASAARNLASSGSLSAEQLYGNLRLAGSYHGVEPAFPALASLWYRFIELFSGGRLQGLYLFPIVCMGTTAGLVVLLAVELGFKQRTGSLAGLTFGVSTIAWPYSKYFFRETLLMFLVMLCWLAFEIALKTGAAPKKLILPIVIFVISLLLSVFTKVMSVLLIPGFLLMFLVKGSGERKWNTIYILIGLIFVVIISSIGVYAIAQRATDLDVFYRYTGSFLRDAFVRYQSIPHDHFWEAIIAPLFSPWKSLFIYSPPCLLIFLALFDKNNPKKVYLFILPVVLTIGFLLIQALAYNEEWWTITWSSRLLLPTVPLFIVSTLPWLERTLQTRNWLRLATVWMVFLGGMVIQLGAVIFHASTYNQVLAQELRGDFPRAVIWNISRMPIWGQWELGKLGYKPDIMLWRVFPFKPELIASVVVLSLAILGIAMLLLKHSDGEHVVKNKIVFDISLLFGNLLILFVLIFKAFSLDPFYYSSQLKDLSTICVELPIGDVVIIKPYHSQAWYYFMNTDCIKNEWFSLPFNNEIMYFPTAKENTLHLISVKLNNSNSVWLIDQIWSKDDFVDDIFEQYGFSSTTVDSFTLLDSKVVLIHYLRK